MSEAIDLGHGHIARFIAFRPNRSIPKNAETFRDIPDDDRSGLLISHGAECDSYIGLNPAVNTMSACWQVVSWEPLTLSPSLLCMRCGDHGFVREGKWVPA